jgi:SulP family sulfate permease
VFRREVAQVELLGLNAASNTIVGRFDIHDNSEEIEKVMGGH